jgi:hypothetical protein
MIVDKPLRQSITLTVSGDGYEHKASLTLDGGLTVEAVGSWLIGAFEAVEFGVFAAELKEAWNA